MTDESAVTSGEFLRLIQCRKRGEPHFRVAVREGASDSQWNYDLWLAFEAIVDALKRNSGDVDATTERMLGICADNSADLSEELIVHPFTPDSRFENRISHWESTHANGKIVKLVTA